MNEFIVIAEGRHNTSTLLQNVEREGGTGG